jgi:anti-sigma B factor antagonist
MQIFEENQDNIYIFKLTGRLDSKTSPEFEKKIVQAIEDGYNQIIVDFEDLEYLSSAGLRVLLKATKRLKQIEGKIVLCSMADYVREVFEISGFDSFLPILAKREDALKEF